MKPTIAVEQETKDKLNEFKIHHRETYNEVILKLLAKELIQKAPGGLNMLNEKQNFCLGLTAVRNGIIIPGLKFLQRGMGRGQYSEVEEATINLTEKKLIELNKFLIDKTEEIYEAEQKRIKEDEKKVAEEQKLKDAELKKLEEAKEKKTRLEQFEEEKAEKLRLQKVKEEEERIQKDISAGKVVEF